MGIIRRIAWFLESTQTSCFHPWSRRPQGMKSLFSMVMRRKDTSAALSYFQLNIIYKLYIYICADLYTWDYPIQLKMGITIHDAKSLSTNQNIGILLLVVSVFKLHTGPFFVGRTSPRDLSCTCNCFQVTFQVLKPWQKAQWLTKVTCPRVKNLAESQESKVCLLLNSSLRCAWFWIEHGRDPLVPLGFSPHTMPICLVEM